MYQLYKVAPIVITGLSPSKSLTDPSVVRLRALWYGDTTAKRPAMPLNFSVLVSLRMLSKLVCHLDITLLIVCPP